MQLNASDREMLDGGCGPAARMAMSILARIGEIQGERELLDITQAHIDSTIYMGEAGLEFAERLAGFGAKVVVPSSLNVSGLERSRPCGIIVDYRHPQRTCFIDRV